MGRVEARLACFLATKKKTNSPHTHTAKTKASHCRYCHSLTQPCLTLTLTLTQSQLSTLSFYFPFTALTHQPPSSIHHPFRLSRCPLCRQLATSCWATAVAPRLPSPSQRCNSQPFFPISTPHLAPPSVRRRLRAGCPGPRNVTVQPFATPPSNPSLVMVGF